MSLVLNNWALFGKELFIPLTVHVFCERLSVCVCSSFRFCFEVGMWNLIVLMADLCLSVYFVQLLRMMSACSNKSKTYCL